MRNCSDCKNNGTQICFVCCSHQGYPDRWEAKPKTNGDRIRATSDEELAKWISHIAYCSDCPMDRQCPINAEQCQGNRSKCYLAWLEWLKSEA